MTAWRSRINEVLNGDGPDIVFQPIHQLEPRTLVGYEALARFDEGTPDEWFAAAWSVGLSYELEVRCLNLALDALPTLPTDAYLAVNISPHNVIHPDVADLLRRHDLSRIVLELTEHDQVENYAALRDALAPLRATGTVVCTLVGPRSRPLARGTDNKGARVSVDDLGAGWASMQHVVQLSPDHMKLDRVLIAGIDASYPQRAMVATLVSFASRMRILTIAEGVETQEELLTVAALDVHAVQGWLTGRPGPLPGP